MTGEEHLCLLLLRPKLPLDKIIIFWFIDGIPTSLSWLKMFWSMKLQDYTTPPTSVCTSQHSWDWFRQTNVEATLPTKCKAKRTAMQPAGSRDITLWIHHVVVSSSWKTLEGNTSFVFKPLRSNQTGRGQILRFKQVDLYRTPKLAREGDFETCTIDTSIWPSRRLSNETSL